MKGFVAWVVAFILVGGCDADADGGTAPNYMDGVGAECETDDDCQQPDGDGIAQECLTNFKGAMLR